jgi:hypothetical protein
MPPDTPDYRRQHRSTHAHSMVAAAMAWTRPPRRHRRGPSPRLPPAAATRAHPPGQQPLPPPLLLPLLLPPPLLLPLLLPFHHLLLASPPQGLPVSPQVWPPTTSVKHWRPARRRRLVLLAPLRTLLELRLRWRLVLLVRRLPSPWVLQPELSAPVHSKAPPPLRAQLS